MPTAKEIAARILSEIDAYAIRTYDKGHRRHLGASQIGKSCSRELYFIFRWIKHVKKSGRTQRLLQRGNLEELRYIEYLRGIGFTVHTHNPEFKLIINELGAYNIIKHDETVNDKWQDVTTDDFHIQRALGKGVKLPQIEISDCGGHFGGGLDAELEFPADWNIPGIFLAEFKTKGTGAGFNDLGKKGVAVANAEHWAQKCTYGYKRNLQYGLYFSTNKNDDDMHIEFVPLDLGLGADMIRKAESIITAERPPARISETITNFKCKWCDFKEECHNGAPIEKNCRSCHHAKPAADAQWYCRQHKAIIPTEFIKDGCPQWLGVI